jgi:DNA topoisomerase-1
LLIKCGAIDPADAASRAGLRYASTEAPGIARRRSGRGFSYRTPAGEAVRDPETLARIRSLVIPPAWTSVWICPDPRGHVQAVGLDEKRRRQYRYHPLFREERDGAKYRRLIAFAESLPAIRGRVSADMAQPGLGRRRVLAALVYLLETTLVRVGNRAYARANNTYGLTTLEERHVEVAGTRLRFSFRGKSGREWNLDLRDRRIARVVRRCQELPGQSLFKYIDDAGQVQTVSSADVNAYLREVAGPEISAKDFRTWGGTVMAAMALAEMGPAGGPAAARRNIARAIRRTAARLGNTPPICRACYVHPDVLAAYLDDDLRLPIDDAGAGWPDLRPEEAAVLALLGRRRAAEDGPSTPAAASAQRPAREVAA